MAEDDNSWRHWGGDHNGVLADSILQVPVGDHRTEEQREVGERVQVQAQRRAPVGTPVQPHRAGDEADPQHERGDEVDDAEASRAEGQLRDGVQEHRVQQDLSAAERDELYRTLKARFEKNAGRHEALDWAAVQSRLDASPGKLWSLAEMERTGGEPDVVDVDRKTGELLFFDCSSESPSGRRSLCYDPEALEARKEHKPKDSALGVAAAMGIELLSEEQYRSLQKLGTFDAKTSSWIQTPPSIRKLGGALFGDFRYGHVFVYHNGAESYYAARGFRGALKI